MNQVILQLMRVAEYEHRKWFDVVDMVEMAINNAPLLDSEYSAFYINYGFYPAMYLDLPSSSVPLLTLAEETKLFISRLRADWKHISSLFTEQRLRMAERANRHRIEHQYSCGDYVILYAQAPSCSVREARQAWS